LAKIKSNNHRPTLIDQTDNIQPGCANEP